MTAVPRLVLAGPSSGAGKTTVAAALMRLARDRGLRVAPFKVGPDYLDPTHHARAAGRPSRNLDGWLLPHATVRALFARATTGARAADLAVIEGVMGLFDGRSGTSEEGSTAEIAKLLGAPVVLVLDAWAMARTAGAVALGLPTFDSALPLAGVVFNRVAGERHYAMCAAAVAERTGLPALGWLPKDPAFAVPERHLGLVGAAERPMDLDHLALQAAATLDVGGLLAVARTAPALADPGGALGDTSGGLLGSPPPAPVAGGRRARIGVARDAAFDFYYEDNLDLLEALGAELVPFSPVGDAGLPADLGALYLGGGYPELHAGRLAENAPMRAAVRAFAASGRPVYAECGGLMYLAEAFVDGEGGRHAMAGVVPGVSRLRPRLTLGYREVVALRDSPIASAGQRVRGHEFHHSALDDPGACASPAYQPAYRRAADDALAETEGVVAGPRGNVLASYLHVHFGTDPSLAERFVASAAAGAPDR